MIEFKNVYKTYPSGVRALKGFNLKIEDGEFVFVLGKSGAGKSTFIKLMLREEKLDKGEIVIGDFSLSSIKNSQIPYLRRSLGVVFQDFKLIKNMTVFDNVAFAMRVTNASVKEIRKRVPEVLGLVGLTGKAKRYPNELSGGEQQRVAIARAIVNKPKLLIADEPTGNVDPQRSFEIVEMLTRINDAGTTVIMVTHEHELVAKFNKRIVIIDGGKIGADSAGRSLT